MFLSCGDFQRLKEGAAERGSNEYRDVQKKERQVVRYIRGGARGFFPSVGESLIQTVGVCLFQYEFNFSRQVKC